MKSLLLLFFFLSVFFSSLAQPNQITDPSTEIGFYDYLLRNNLFIDAQLQYQRMLGFNKFSSAQVDSINYLTGWSLYQSKQLDSSSFFLLQVSSSSPQFIKSRFFSAYNHIYLKNFDSGLAILDSLEQKDSLQYLRLINLEKSGIALLKNDLEGFIDLSKEFDGSYYATADEEQKLKSAYAGLMAIKNKSSVKAALLSTVVPGLGKIYAGKTGEGVISFVQVSALGLIAAESLNKSGANSVRFVTTAALFSLFYIGNIWGSFFSVRLDQIEKRNEIHNSILFNMHIPLRTVFN